MLDDIGIVGVGLIGASIGLGLKARGLCRRVVGVGRSAGSLQAAKDVGAIDEAFVGIDDRLADVEMLILCTPVDQIADQAAQAEEFIPRATVITDAGSTKGTIVRSACKRLMHPGRFIGSHPIAGSDKRGPRAADADLFVGKTCVLTPTDETDRETVRGAEAFWSGLGMNIVKMAPEAHDEIVARTSHLPHLAAAALMLQLDESDWPLIGTGLRDASRIAGGDPDLWTAICSQNRDALLAAIDRYRDKLEELRASLADDNLSTTRKLLDNGKRRRDSLVD